MKHILTNIALLVTATVLLLSCENPLDPERRQRVAVSAVVETIGIEVKSATETASEANVFGGIGITPLNSKIIYSLGTHSGSSFVTFTDNNPEWIKSENDYLTYKDNNTFSCIGLYPATSDNDAWEIYDGKAIHTIDGSTDLMFAPKITSNNDSPTAPTLQYGHLLTWVNVLVSANTIDAISHWGKITKISIGSYANVEIGIDDGSISYSGNHPITTYTDTEGLPLNITTTPAGSVFVAPSTKLKVTVYTTVFTEGKTVDVTLRDLNNQDIPEGQVSDVRGKLFVLNLTFTPLSILEGTCTLNYWNDQDEDLFLS